MKVPPLDLELVYRDGKPVRAIVNLDALAVLLDAAEDIDDIEYLHSLKEEELRFVSIEEYLNGRGCDDDPAADGDQGHGTNISDRHREAS